MHRDYFVYFANKRTPASKSTVCKAKRLALYSLLIVRGSIMGQKLMMVRDTHYALRAHIKRIHSTHAHRASSLFHWTVSIDDNVSFEEHNS